VNFQGVTQEHVPPVGNKEIEGKRQDKEEKRRRTDGFSQGPKRKFRKLQGLVCKAKFSHRFKTRMKKCPKRKLESFSNSTTLL
jgi:hypothetical protein